MKGVRTFQRPCRGANGLGRPPGAAQACPRLISVALPGPGTKAAEEFCPTPNRLFPRVPRLTNPEPSILITG